MRDRRETSIAGDLIDDCESGVGAVIGRDQISRCSRHAYGPGTECRVLDSAKEKVSSRRRSASACGRGIGGRVLRTAKEILIGGVKDSCKSQ